MKVLDYLKKDAVLSVSLVLAVISSFINKPSKAYLTYIDFHTLLMLFSLMTIMGGLQHLGLFKRLGEKMLVKIKTSRSLEAILILLCFFSSMLITNDVSLITFVPFGIIIMNLVGYKNKLRVILMQTIAANLGSMFTPIGNPQNLYLYSYFKIDILEFIKITLPYTLISLGLILIYLMSIKKEALEVKVEESKEELDKKQVLMYLSLFVLSLLVVLKVVPISILIILLITFVLVFDKKGFKRVDYSLILTFVFFFIFIGNMKTIESFSSLLSKMVINHEVLVSVLASQVISNVPASLLLASFTSNYSGLIIGTNIGGLGTMIASMASLISYKQVVKNYSSKRSKYFKLFTIYNLIFLVILYAFYLVLA